MRTVLFASLIAFLYPAFVLAAESSAPLAASGQADEAEFYFLRGNRAYQDKRFEDALSAYYLSNRLVPNRNVQFNIARCLDRMGRYDEAYRAWSSLSEQALPEKEKKAVQDAIDQLRPHLALLVVESSPPGATIYAGRRDLGALGTTPKSLALTPGMTKILLEHDGYRPVELAAEPARGQQVKLSAVLERIYGQVEIRRVPQTAEVRRDFIDGALLRQGPGPAQVVPGPLVLFVSAPGYQTARVLVDVPADASLPVDVLLSPAMAPSGTVVIRSNITGALVRIDGKEAGFTPAVIDGVPTGTRTVEVVEENRRPFVETIDVKKGERAFVDAYLAHADPEVTAATKSAIASESAPASISIVTADEIAAFGYTSLTEALTAVRGAFTSNDRSYESVGFRGFSPPGDYTNRVLVLVDGHPVNDAVTGQGYVGHDFDVDLSNVARIEVVRGPGSVLYGTGALFGVINVVTRRAAEGEHASASGMAGTLETLLGRATASARSGDTDVLLSGAGLHSSGDNRYVWPASQTGSTPITVLNADGESAYHADFAAHAGPLSLRAAFNDRKKYLPTGAYDTQPVAGTNNHDRRFFAELHFDENLRGFQLAARAAYDLSWYRGTFLPNDPTVSAGEALEARWVTGEARVGLPRFWAQQFTVGAEVVRQLKMQTDQPFNGNPPIPNDLILSAYIVDDIRLSSRFAINAGLRSDSYTKSFGTTLSPRVAVVAKPYANGNTKLFVGQSFRAPSPNERANNPTEDLQPETIWSGELEHSHAVTDDFHLVGAVFANWVNHLITLTGADPANQYYVNHSDRVRSIGAEAEARWEPGGGTLVSLSATRQRVEELAPGGNQPFLNAPETMVKARVLCPLVGTALRLGSELVLDSGRPFRPDGPPLSDNFRTDDAFLWNLSFSGGYRAYHVHYFAGLFNVFDVHDARAGFPTSVDYPPVLIPRYGRSLRAGLSFGF
jgi:outer membrane receptor for ferrienterochelin and colicins